jgi:polyphosphate kinase
VPLGLSKKSWLKKNYFSSVVQQQTPISFAQIPTMPSTRNIFKRFKIRLKRNKHTNENYKE